MNKLNAIFWGNHIVQYEPSAYPRQSNSSHCFFKSSLDVSPALCLLRTSDADPQGQKKDQQKKYHPWSMDLHNIGMTIDSTNM